MDLDLTSTILFVSRRDQKRKIIVLEYLFLGHIPQNALGDYLSN